MFPFACLLIPTFSIPAQFEVDTVNIVEQSSCWLEVSRKGNPSIFSVGYCQLINREIGASSSLNILSTHSTHFFVYAKNPIFINHVRFTASCERMLSPTLFVVGEEVVVVVTQQSSLHRVRLGLGHRDWGGVGHGGHCGRREHQGRHVNTVTHRPEHRHLCKIV